MIPLERVLVVNPIGNDPLTTKSKEAYHTMTAVYLVWPTKERIPMARNCKFVTFGFMHTYTDMENNSFITYRPCTHLDEKHTIFGRVVGGLDVLNQMEAVPTNEKDRPERDIRIKEVSIFVDPFEEFQGRLKRKLAHEANTEQEEQERKQKRAKEDSMGWFGPNVANSKKAGSGGIGKYLASSSSSKKKSSSSYGNFDQF